MLKMKFILGVLVGGLLHSSGPTKGLAQTNDIPMANAGRSDLDESLAPFYHGVASGDPLPDAVIIWTRITLPDETPVSVNWRMALDTSFISVVASGSTAVGPATDWTVQVDVIGLDADTWYYYEFEHNGQRSIMGRTHTAPVGGVEQLRFGVVSCSNYEHGLFNAYRSLAQRNDIDAVLHLGDYIYEYEVGGYSINMAGRTNEPPNEIITLEDYRTRYSHYRLDADLREIHRQYPFIVIWDDHESANDSWYGGAENHTPASEGPWADRKAAAIRANEEWMPMRKPDPDDTERIYREFSFGDMADIMMLDTRLYARDLQGSGTGQNRNLLGQPQRQWLYSNLSTSAAKWKLIGQQVMVAPLVILGIPVNTDQWDGYPGERDSLLNHLLNNQIDNAVVLTGDIHTSWGNDLRLGAGTFTAGTPVAVEFVVTSVTSPGFPFNVGSGIIQSSNQHVKYLDLTRHGYLILDLTDNAAQSDWYYISTKTDPVFTTTFGAGWKTNDGDNFLSQANAATVGSAYPPLAPIFSAAPVSAANEAGSLDGIIVSAYPNPFIDHFVVQFNIFGNERVSATLYDLAGKTLIERDLGMMTTGLHYLEMETPDMPAGVYMLSLSIGKDRFSRTMVRR
jgi:alkaline phosphatase D